MDRDRLLQALAAADAAGDVDAATKFATQLRGMEAPARDLKAEFEQMGPVDKGVTALADVTRLASNGLTMNFRDKGAAGLKALFGDQDYETNLASERQATQDAKARAGSAGVASEIGGAMTLGAGAGKMGVDLMSRVPQSAGFLTRLLGMGAAGAGEGAVYEAGSALGKDEPALPAANDGVVAGAVGGMGGEVLSTMLNKFLGRGMGHAPDAPTMDELLADSNALRDQLKGRNYQVSPDDVGLLNQNLRRNLTDAVDGPRKIAHPRTVDEIDKLAEYTPSLKVPVTKASNTVRQSSSDSFNTTQRNNNPPVMNSVRKSGLSDATTRTTKTNLDPDRGMSLYDLDLHRQAVQKNAASSMDKSESGQGSRLIREIDNFTRNNVPPREAEQLFEARGIEHRTKKLEEVGKVVRAADRHADAANTENAGSGLRGKVAHMLNNERDTRGFTPQEIQQMEDLVKGSTSGNLMRDAAKIAGSVPGYGLGLGIGGSVGNLVGGPAAAGYGGTAGLLAAAGAKKGLSKMAERQTDKQAEELMDTIARGYKKSPRKAPKVMPAGSRDALVRYLTLLGLEDEDGDKAEK
jgi:hypothetical protein